MLSVNLKGEQEELKNKSVNDIVVGLEQNSV